MDKVIPDIIALLHINSWEWISEYFRYVYIHNDLWISEYLICSEGEEKAPLCSMRFCFPVSWPGLPSAGSQGSTKHRTNKPWGMKSIQAPVWLLMATVLMPSLLSGWEEFSVLLQSAPGERAEICHRRVSTYYQTLLISPLTWASSQP